MAAASTEKILKGAPLSKTIVFYKKEFSGQKLINVQLDLFTQILKIDGQFAKAPPLSPTALR